MVQGQKYHMLYKTTCTVTGNFYVGVHSTTSLEDDYLGSGIRLSRSIEKHGKENHVREILELFDSREDLMKKEREIVNEEMLADPKCMNLKKGGEGGMSMNLEQRREHGRRVGSKNFFHAQERFKELRKDTIFERKRIESIALSHQRKTGSRNGWKGRAMTDAHKAAIASTRNQKGEKNSQYGTRWIFHEELKKCIRISKLDTDIYLKKGWQLGRRMTLSR